MAHPIPNTNISTDTWSTVITNLNLAASEISVNVITVAPNSSGEITTGNAVVNGWFSVNVLAVANIQGGNISTPANAFFTTNVNIQGNTYMNGGSVSATLFIGNGTVNATLNSIGLFGTSLLQQKVNTTVFAANGTYTKNANLIYATVYVVGAGAGGGGVTGAATATGAMGAPGGGGGEFRKAIIANSAIRAGGEPVTVGIGGTGGTNSTVAATGGSNSVFGNSTSTFTAITAVGGSAAAATGTSVNGGAGGSGGAGGNTNITGETGEDGAGTGLTLTNTWSGKGGSSHYGFGGAGVTSNTTGRSLPGVLFGGSGSGAAISNAAASATGGVGANGTVIIEEHFLG